MINSLITSAIGKKTSAEVTEKNALKVATVEYETYNPTVKFFTSEIHGVDLNQNFSNEGAGNANESIHNGIDSVEWTATPVVGTWDFNSSNNPDSGSYNIEMIVSTVGDTAQFNRGANITMDAHTGFVGRLFITLTGHIQAELNFFAWNTAAAIVGNAVNLYDYVNPALLGVWQTFAIPLADMGLNTATFDAVRVQVTGRSGATFDLDNIVLADPTGSSAYGTSTYSMAPDLGRSLHIDGFLINMADSYAGTIVNGTMPSLPYNSFMALPALESPILFQVIDYERITFTGAFSQMIDFMQFAEPEIKMAGSDATNSWFTIYIGLKAPIKLHAKLAQKINLTISEDLSALKFFRWSADCKQVVES